MTSICVDSDKLDALSAPKVSHLTFEKEKVLPPDTGELGGG